MVLIYEAAFFFCNHTYFGSTTVLSDIYIYIICMYIFVFEPLFKTRLSQKVNMP